MQGVRWTSHTSSMRSKPFLAAAHGTLRLTERIGGRSVLLHDTDQGVHRSGVPEVPPSHRSRGT